ncbi:hypothetical protein UIB01_10405 [Stutzerimonas decontaminans]|uniref:Uncharacterized protein n=1 Tax=Stutzerimonas stutzeri TaxID=316 RepID=A0A023WYG8_STUST|nr:hypothetical protein UIB01_10405 [Stutzerimonas decontaminans]
MNTDTRKLWKQRLELIPDPFCQVFASRVFQTRDVVQIVVIEQFVQRLEYGFYFAEITNPACMQIDRTTDIQRDPERMAVQPSTFVPLRHVGQAVGRFECKFFKYFHAIHSSSGHWIGARFYAL